MLIAGNWKMHKGPGETGDFCRALRGGVEEIDSIGIEVYPPFVSLPAAIAELRGSAVRVGAQNVHWEDEGAFTGEVSAPMLVEIGATTALVGHSERRQYFGETDETTARRAVAALDGRLDVIACVGETESERERGETEDVLRRQVSILADAVGDPEGALVVAYEPVWAIGTGKTATPEIAQEAHAFIKDLWPLVDILYGGSVKPENAEELLAQPAVDGALVGGASLDVESFSAICWTAARLSRS
jgi:triosephosphate isomerase